MANGLITFDQYVQEKGFDNKTINRFWKYCNQDIPNKETGDVEWWGREATNHNDMRGYSEEFDELFEEFKNINSSRQIKSSNDQIDTQEIIKDLDEKICHILYLTFGEPFWLRKYEPGTKIDKDNFLITFASSNYKVLLHWINNLDYYQGDFQIIGEDVDLTKQSFSSSLSLDDFISQFSKTLSSWTKNGFIESARQIKSGYFVEDEEEPRVIVILQEVLKQIANLLPNEWQHQFTDVYDNPTILTVWPWHYDKEFNKVTDELRFEFYNDGTIKSFENGNPTGEDIYFDNQGWEQFRRGVDFVMQKLYPKRIYQSRRIQSMRTPKNVYLNEDTQKLIQRLEKRVGHELKLKFEEGNTPYVEIEKLPKGGYSFITKNYLNKLAEHFLYDGYKEKQDSFIVYLDPAIMYTRPGIKSSMGEMQEWNTLSDDEKKRRDEPYNKAADEWIAKQNQLERERKRKSKEVLDYWRKQGLTSRFNQMDREVNNMIKSTYTREDYDRFDEVGNFIPYNPTSEELAKKDEIKKVLKQELSDAYEPDPMDDYVGYDSTNERIDMACERVAKQFGVDTDFVEDIAGEIQNEDYARTMAESEWIYEHCTNKDKFWDWQNGEDVSLEELGIDKEQMDKEVNEMVNKYVNSSRKPIKSSIITPWDTNQVTGTSDEDLGLSAVVDIYGNEFVNVDESTLNELKDTLVRYFDDEAYVRDWNINNPDYQIEEAFEVTDPEEMSAEDLARYFDYEAYGRDIRLEDNIVWDSENQYWVSAHDVDDEELNDDKYIFMRG